MIGDIYTTQAGFGYFMVMGRARGTVFISPLFWIRGPILIWPMPRKVFKAGYRPFDIRVVDGYMSVVQAAFDREWLRRSRWIAATGGRFGQDQSSGYVHGHGRSGKQEGVLHEGERRCSAGER